MTILQQKLPEIFLLASSWINYSPYQERELTGISNITSIDSSIQSVHGKAEESVRSDA